MHERKHRTTAVILVKSPKVFSWLGHLPIMNWSVTQLLEVRGVDRITCIATSDLVKRAKEMLIQHDIEAVGIPAEVTKRGDADIEKWLVSVKGPACDADVVALVRPTSPFLPAAKIESCIDFVVRNFADTCCTVQEVNAWSGAARSQVYIEAPGCKVFAPLRVAEKPIGRFRPVQVSLVESLDVTESDGHRLVKALVADGM
jgi:hypothetical protein